MKKLLHLKHWQVFMLTYGLMLVLYFIMILGLLFGFQGLGVVSFGVIGLLILASVTVMSVLYLWFWTVGNELHRKLPDGMKMNLKFFRVAVIFPAAYIALIFISFGLMFMMESEPGAWMVLMVIPHLFTMFCMFYIFYFIGKALKSVEMGKEAHAGDYIGEFFLLWFFIIGVWFIQPTLNRIFSKNKEGMERHLVE